MYIVHSEKYRVREHDEGLYMSELWMASGGIQKKRCRVLQMWGEADGINQNVVWQICVSE